MTHAAYLLMGRATGISSIQWLIYSWCRWYASAILRNILRHRIVRKLDLHVSAPAANLLLTAA